jgi:hypothetical protein
MASGEQRCGIAAVRVGVENAHLDVSKLLNEVSVTEPLRAARGLLGEWSNDLHVSRAFDRGRFGLGDR